MHWLSGIYDFYIPILSVILPMAEQFKTEFASGRIEISTLGWYKNTDGEQSIGESVATFDIGREVFNWECTDVHTLHLDKMTYLWYPTGN